MLHVIQTFGDELPSACQNSCDSAWSIFDNFLAKYGSDYDLCERTTRVLRHGLTLFGNSALPVAASVMSRLISDFDTTGFPSNLWIAGKIIQRFGNEEDLRLRSSFQEVYERSTRKIITMLQAKSPGEIPDGTFPFYSQVSLPHAYNLLPLSSGGLYSLITAAGRTGTRCLLPIFCIPACIPRINGCPHPCSL